MSPVQQIALIHHAKMIQENVMNVLQLIIMEKNVKKHAHHFAMGPIYLFVIELMAHAIAPLTIFLMINALNVKKDIIIVLKVVLESVLIIVRRVKFVIKMMGIVIIANMASGMINVTLYVINHVKQRA